MTTTTIYTNVIRKEVNNGRYIPTYYKKKKKDRNNDKVLHKVVIFKSSSSSSSSSSTSSFNSLTPTAHTQTAQLGGHITAALFTLRYERSCVSVAVVTQPYHTGPVPRGRKAAVRVGVDGP